MEKIINQTGSNISQLELRNKDNFSVLLCYYSLNKILSATYKVQIEYKSDQYNFFLHF